MNPLIVQLRSLANLLLRTKRRYVILGGLAVSIYGEPRLTRDIDINIILGKFEINSFLKDARKYGFSTASSESRSIAERTGVLALKFKKGKTTGSCDIIMAENPLEYASIERGRPKKIYSIKARLITPEDLIIHKITSSRPRDAEDLKGILIRQKGKLDIKYIEGWLKKIDTADKNANLLGLFKALLREL